MVVSSIIFIFELYENQIYTMSTNNFCVIMAGGVGSRFWPLSRNHRPKQFLDILGTGRTMLQQTYDRFSRIIPDENILIVTHQDYYALVKEQLPEISENNILLEPQRKNTAPCIAYANYKIKALNPDANIVVSPADHLILNTEEFLRVITGCLDFAGSNKSSLMTIGIKPSRPETGYGYIQIDGRKKDIEKQEIVKVKTFTEKPDIEMAKVFVESGEYFWNSGVFIWSLNAIQSAFESHLSDVDQLFKEGVEKYNCVEEKEFIKNTYQKTRSISIDFGIMEKVEDSVFVFCSDFGWSDLGTWGSLYENSEKDTQQNSIVGSNTFVFNTKNSIVRIGKEKLAVIQGLDNYIVVEADDILLICKKEDEQEIKKYVNDISLKKGSDYI